MKQLKVKILANDKVSNSFYKMKLASNYLAKSAKPGQFIEVRCTAGVDPLLRRPLGVHRITKSGIEVLYEIVGKGTELLSAQKAGRELDIIGPLGNGFGIRHTKYDVRTTILVAGGIGVAPLVALAEELGNAHVIIGARTKSHVLCENEFKRLGCTVSVATEDGSKGHKGLATDLLKDALAARKNTQIYPAPEAPDDRAFQRNAQIYACGPTGMLKAVAQIAASHHIKCQVSLEERMACGVGVCLGCPVKVKSGDYRIVCKDGPVFNAEDIAW
jgi:dihydroorotate dehydrogenase electron transfer subunit